MIIDHQREFIRHPADIPISVKPEGSQNQMSLALNNVSCGGLAFLTPKELMIGTVVSIRISAVKPIFKVKAIVAWCIPKNNMFEAGVEFIGEEDAYKVRMVEQVCHIEHYKRSIQEHEGRVLSGESAALEWIEKYASDFPNPN